MALASGAPLAPFGSELSMHLASPSIFNRRALLGWQYALVVCLGCSLAVQGAKEPATPTTTPQLAFTLLAGLHAPSAALLGKHTIPVHRTGTLAVNPSMACDLLARTNLLALVQEQYARQLPVGQTPEFAIQHTGTNTYAYVNRHGQRSEITEVGRLALVDAGFAILVYAFGERDFGRFESLTYVTVAPAPDVAGCRYEVVVYAYPHSAVRRFFARHLGLVERYFRNKTTEMEALVTHLCVALCEQ